MESENLKRLLRLMSTDSDTATADDVKREIAAEYNIPEQLADRLRGDSLQDIKADAETLAGIIGVKRNVAPLADPETSSEESDNENESYRKMIKALRAR